MLSLTPSTGSRCVFAGGRFPGPPVLYVMTEGAGGRASNVQSIHSGPAILVLSLALKINSLSKKYVVQIEQEKTPPRSYAAAHPTCDGLEELELCV